MTNDSRQLLPIQRGIGTALYEHPLRRVAWLLALAAVLISCFFLLAIVSNIPHSGIVIIALFTTWVAFVVFWKPRRPSRRLLKDLMLVQLLEQKKTLEQMSELEPERMWEPLRRKPEQRLVLLENLILEPKQMWKQERKQMLMLELISMEFGGAFVNQRPQAHPPLNPEAEQSLKLDRARALMRELLGDLALEIEAEQTPERMLELRRMPEKMRARMRMQMLARIQKQSSDRALRFDVGVMAFRLAIRHVGRPPLKERWAQMLSWIRETFARSGTVG